MSDFPVPGDASRKSVELGRLPPAPSARKVRCICCLCAQRDEWALVRPDSPESLTKTRLEGIDDETVEVGGRARGGGENQDDLATSLSLRMEVANYVMGSSETPPTSSPRSGRQHRIVWSCELEGVTLHVAA